MKKNAIAIVSIVLNIALLLMVRSLSAQVESLRGTVGRLEREVEEVSEEAGRLRREMSEAEKLCSDYSLDPTGLDAESKTLLADVFVTLKSWGEDTRVTLLVNQGGRETSFPMTHEGQGRFTVPVFVEVKSGEVGLDTRITTAGVTTKEALGGWGDVSMLLPLQMSSWGWSDPSFDKGTLTLHSHSVSLQDRIGSTVPAWDTEFYVYINGEKTESIPAAAEDFDVYGYHFEDYTLTHPVQVGDQLSVAFACRDEYGLHYEFSLYTWDVVETADQNSFTTVGGESIPKLSWD